MSVAAISAKRPMEWDSPMQGREFSPNCRAQQKRFRLSMSPPRSSLQAPSSPLFHKESAAQRPTYHNPDSQFNVNVPAAPFERHLDQKMVKRARTRLREELENSSSLYFRMPSPLKKEQEVLFTLDQVKTIVARALEERDATIRQQYDRILQEKLAEQYNAFAQFNQDNIHRQMTESTYNYML